MLLQHTKHYKALAFREITVPHLTHLLPSAAHLFRWTGTTLLHMMACRQVGAKPIPEPLLKYCYLDPQEQTSEKLRSKYGLYINRNAFDNVCEIPAIFSWERWFNTDKLCINRLISVYLCKIRIVVSNDLANWAGKPAGIVLTFVAS